MLAQVATSDLTGTNSISMGSDSDGAWRRAARVALFLIAGLTASAAPRSPFSAPPPAAAAPGAATRSGQVADDPTQEGEPVDPDDADEADDEEALPIPVFEDDAKGSPFDSASTDTLPPGTGARPDSASLLPAVGGSAEPETLRYVPPGERPVGPAPGPKKPGDEPAAIVKKPKGGPFGLPPIAVILGLTVVHVFVVKLALD